MIPCPFCEQLNPPGIENCMRCMAQLGQWAGSRHPPGGLIIREPVIVTYIMCPHCHAPVGPGRAACAVCGKPVAPPAPKLAPPDGVEEDLRRLAARQEAEAARARRARASRDAFAQFLGSWCALVFAVGVASVLPGHGGLLLDIGAGVPGGLVAGANLWRLARAFVAEQKG